MTDTTGFSLDTSLVGATVAIALATIAGVLTAAVQPGAPLEGAFWVAAVVAGITALASLVRREFDVED